MVIATALALVASSVAYVELHSVQEKADMNAVIRPVYVLRSAVPEGVTVANAMAEGLIEATRTPSELIPAGAARSLAGMRDDVSIYPLVAGEVVTSGMFVSPKLLASPAAQKVPAGDVAVAVTADQVHSVDGFLQPGNKVDIMVDVDGLAEQFLYESVPVLAVGTALVSAPAKLAAATTGNTTGAVKTNNVITFAVPPAFADRIAQANSNGGGVTGGVYLALMGPDSATAPTEPGLVTNPVLAGPLAAQHVHASRTNELTP